MWGDEMRKKKGSCLPQKGDFLLTSNFQIIKKPWFWGNNEFPEHESARSDENKSLISFSYKRSANSILSPFLLLFSPNLESFFSSLRIQNLPKSPSNRATALQWKKALNRRPSTAPTRRPPWTCCRTRQNGSAMISRSTYQVRASWATTSSIRCWPLWMCRAKTAAIIFVKYPIKLDPEDPSKVLIWMWFTDRKLH